MFGSYPTYVVTARKGKAFGHAVVQPDAGPPLELGTVHVADLGPPIAGVIKEPRPSSRVFVQVVRADGGGPAGVLPPHLMRQQGAVRVFAGHDGRFELDGLAPGRYHVSLFAAGWPDRKKTVSLPPSERRLEIGFGVDKSVRGRVLGPDGTPMVGVEVHASPWRSRCITDHGGRFELWGTGVSDNVTLSVVDLRSTATSDPMVLRVRETSHPTRSIELKLAGPQDLKGTVAAPATRLRRGYVVEARRVASSSLRFVAMTQDSCCAISEPERSKSARVGLRLPAQPSGRRRLCVPCPGRPCSRLSPERSEYNVE